MTPIEKNLSEFIRHYKVNDEKLCAALRKAAHAEASYEDLERLWYSKEFSRLRHGKVPAEKKEQR